MASAERDKRLAGVYREPAAAERRHAARWAGQLERLGAGRRSDRAAVRGPWPGWPVASAPRCSCPRWPPASSSTDAVTRSNRRPATISAKKNARMPACSPSFAPPRLRGGRPMRSRAPSAPGRAWRQRPARDRARRQRRPRLEPQPGHGRGGSRAPERNHSGDGNRRAARRRLVDGDGRMDLRPKLTRALRTPDRRRAHGDRHDAGARDRGARAHLPGAPRRPAHRAEARTKSRAAS